MKNIRILLSFLFFIFLTACTTDSSNENEAVPEEAPALSPTIAVDVLPRATITPLSGIESAPEGSGYPIATPVPIPTIDGYPAPPTLAPPTAYPEPIEGSVWVLFPVGEQCADGTGRYEDLATAVAALTAAGVPVQDSEVAELIVCASCGCPTSAHYRLEIDAIYLETVKSLEWIEDVE